MFAVAPQTRTDGSNGDMIFTHQFVTSTSQDAILSINGYACGYSLTDDGWVAEIAIPWTMLREDMIAKVDTDVTVEAGTELNALLVYWDYNAERTVHQYYGTTMTGYTTQFGWHPEEFGIHMTLLRQGKIPESRPETGITDPPVSSTESETEPTVSSTAESQTVPSDTLAETDASVSAIETTVSATTDVPEDDGANALPQGAVIGLLVTGAIAVISVIVGIAVSRRKKK